MDALAGPASVAAALLVVAGGVKLKKPLPATGSLALLKLPRSTILVRALGCLEIAVGGAALVTDSRVMYWAVAGAYVAFAAFTAWALYTGQPLASCGCFGEPDTPATPLHVLLTLAAAAATASAAVHGSPSLRTLLATGHWTLLPLATFIGLALYLAFLLFTASNARPRERKATTTWAPLSSYPGGRR